MEESKKSPQTPPQGDVECAKCHRQVAAGNGKQKNGKSICNDCIKKAKRNKLIAICAILACCIAGGIVWYYVGDTARRTASGFDGVSEINDTVNVEVDSVKVEFNLATSTLTSSPVTTQSPVNNIEDFKRLVAQNVDAAKSSNTNELSIPVSSAQFGFKSATITPEADKLIKEIASLYNQTSKENTIVVEGYACNIGEDAPNDYVSQQRAEAVKATLIENGINPSKITTKWYGKSKNSEFNLPKNEDNRRVLISVK